MPPPPAVSDISRIKRHKFCPSCPQGHISPIGKLGTCLGRRLSRGDTPHKKKNVGNKLPLHLIPFNKIGLFSIKMMGFSFPFTLYSKFYHEMKNRRPFCSDAQKKKGHFNIFVSLIDVSQNHFQDGNKTVGGTIFWGMGGGASPPLFYLCFVPLLCDPNLGIFYKVSI